MWPDVRDERLMELQRRGLDARPHVEWRTNGTFVSLLFFVLTSIAIAASYFFFDLIDIDRGGIVVAVIAIAVAELLIRRFRFFGTGVESALWLGGVFAFIFGLPGEGRPEALLLFAAGSGVAGWRVRNALFGALAVVFVIGYAFVKDAPIAGAAIGVAVSIVALFALAREWQRPSTEKLWIALLVIPPIASAFPSLESTPPIWIAVYSGMAVACVIAGLRLRAHAPLIGAGVFAVIAAAKVEAHDLLPWAPEWKAIAAGVALLAVSTAIARALRERTNGVVATPDALTRFDEEMQILATVAAQPRVTPASEREGGRFGGAGATGDY